VNNAPTEGTDPSGEAQDVPPPNFPVDKPNINYHAKGKLDGKDLTIDIEASSTRKKVSTTANDLPYIFIDTNARYKINGKGPQNPVVVGVVAKFDYSKDISFAQFESVKVYVRKDGDWKQFDPPANFKPYEIPPKNQNNPNP
jgi:hypothetical protein